MVSGVESRSVAEVDGSGARCLVPDVLNRLPCVSATWLITFMRHAFGATPMDDAVVERQSGGDVRQSQEQVERIGENPIQRGRKVFSTQNQCTISATKLVAR
ncbi:hypothetical protein D9M69_131460 [compost metagenome]